eukprot:c5220_g1_i1.p1 GENE.c5220_g1_i1~~c5220_g1_i1.p1  ORF type:complete len:315 (+),score=87.94 c5220_g1_i1:85-945(+)
MEKYMTPVPSYLANFVDYLNRDRSSLPEYELTLVDSMKDAIQKHIKEHFETHAMTRQKFVSMPAELWKDYTNGLFNLTEKPRKVLGYLPKDELTKLDGLVKAPLTSEIERRRADLESWMDKMRASDADRAEIADTLKLSTFYFADLEKHQQEVEKWSALGAKKVVVIEDLEKREEFLEEVEEFERKASGDPDRYKRANSLALAEENKFRAYATKKLKELNAKAEKNCLDYEKDTGRVFEIDGIKYLDMIKEQGEGRASTPGLSLGKLRPRRGDEDSKIIRHKKSQS